MYSISVETISALAPKMPRPQGYKILIAVAKVNEKKGSLYLPEQYQDLENTATILGYVLDMGNDCYRDTNKFPSGPFCKKGDMIMFRVYSGTRFKVGEQEFRLINDDQVEALVDDISVINRV